ncbi:MAG: 30S ribosomal protein S16 [Candidatus Liptonbacteria bacterium]|nr:30S ribosomal protein S16 [Candidatus Liptonbacteria bacterium]
MLVIRLQRIGKKHQPSYRIAVAERRSKVGAPPTEDLGSYEPSSKKITVNKERVAHWIKVGAQPSATIWNLFVKEKVVEGKPRPVKINKPKTAEGAAPAASEAKPAEKPAA